MLHSALAAEGGVAAAELEACFAPAQLGADGGDRLLSFCTRAEGA